MFCLVWSGVHLPAETTSHCLTESGSASPIVRFNITYLSCYSSVIVLDFIITVEVLIYKFSTNGWPLNHEKLWILCTLKNLE